MRNYEFRGYCTASHNWFYGSLLNLPGRTPFIVVPRGDGYDKVPVFPDSIGQNTGLHDADGKPIFEGDVLQETGCELTQFVAWQPHMGEYCLFGYAPGCLTSEAAKLRRVVGTSFEQRMEREEIL